MKTKIMTNVLYYGDNLDILRNRDYFKDESVDLIYLDPPFNSQANYNVLFKDESGESSKSQIEAFTDFWHWDEESAKTFDYLTSHKDVPSQVSSLITALHSFLGNNPMSAYLVMMTVRLLELKRVLKPTGSIYLHCDPTASHYLKIVMDSIFGEDSFRNEIVWCYTGASSPNQRQFPRKHGIIFWYSKGKTWTFNEDAVRTPYSEATLQRIQAGEKGGASSESIFHGKRTKREVNESGKIIEDWWEIPVVGSTAKERLGYPTQKPLALLERIIKASSDKGEVILDPFCGCGTTIDASEKLGRTWIGIDITHLAINLIKRRIKDRYPHVKFDVVGEPKDLSGAIDLAKNNRYQFEWWALSLVDARPINDKKKGSDRGIDGIIVLNRFNG